MTDTAVVKRSTSETRINLEMRRGEGKGDVLSGVPFLDHMMVTFARYAALNLTLRVEGDLTHHIVEDVAIAMGSAVAELVGESAARYGDRNIPMDDALVHVCVDLGGRPYYRGPLPSGLYDHWMRSFSDNAKATLHIRVLRGTDRHHVVEAAFKALGLAVRDAMVDTGAVFSTKGRVSARPPVTLTRRVVVCLDVSAGRVVKGTGFVRLRDIGDPVELAERYESAGADELVFLDISATEEQRGTMLDVARRTAERLFIPLTIGGGVRDVRDINSVLRAGADKVAINSAAVYRPELIGEAAAIFGSQCVVASIDARRTGNSWTVYTHGGRRNTGLGAVEWARDCVRRGAGEVLITSIDCDGSRDGYDIALTRAVADSVQVPVIASGGAGSAEDIVAAFESGGADAALVAGIVHDGSTTIEEIKQRMRESGLRVRIAA